MVNNYNCNIFVNHEKHVKIKVIYLKIKIKVLYQLHDGQIVPEVLNFIASMKSQAAEKMKLL